MYQCHGACAEVDSDTEAVAGKGFKLGCISCKRRSEVEGSATVEWYFRAKGEADFVRVSPCPTSMRPARFYITSSVLPPPEECPWVRSCRLLWGHLRGHRGIDFFRLFYTRDHRDRKSSGDGRCWMSLAAVLASGLPRVIKQLPKTFASELNVRKNYSI